MSSTKAGNDSWQRLLGLITELFADDSTIHNIGDAVQQESSGTIRFPQSENRRHARILIRGVIAALEERRGANDDDLIVAARLGTERAEQGISALLMIGGVHSGRSRAVSLIVERAREEGATGDELLDMTLAIDRYFRSVVHAMTAAHRTREMELLHTAHDLRAQTLRALLCGEASGLSAATLTSAGLERGRLYYCVVTDHGDPSTALPTERALAANKGLVGFVEGLLCAVVAAPPASAQVTDNLTVFAPAVELTDLPKQYQLCRAGLRTARRLGRNGLFSLVDLAFHMALEAQQELGDLLCREILFSVDTGNATHRDLIRTARAYLDSGCRLNVTAITLNVHANSVKYRLKRLEELTGIDLMGAEAAPTHGAAVNGAVLWWAFDLWLRQAEGSKGTSG